ncbi:MAG: glycosyltransferase family 4 protein [Oscillospiraceae bacterium]|jgi:glycosyltransferase involved in cell wall biosynthesis|nr:glycosyltransferase family 4 protein [Oscillospiraceae bacterium]
MIRVVNVITDSNIGGAGMVLLNFMKNTDRREFRHTVVLPRGSMLAARLRELEIDTLEIDIVPDKSFSPEQVCAFRRVFRELKPDVVHTHASLAARAAARLCGCATVHTRHCAYENSRALMSFPMRQLVGTVNNALSDVIIAISPAAAEKLLELGSDPSKIATMMNGAERAREMTPAEKAAARAELQISESEFVCSIIARLEPVKGHGLVLDAAEALRELPIRFIIAGDGSLCGALHASAAARDLKNCVFTGFVPDIWRIENITDVQINASYSETSNMSLIEGMSIGVPAIASDAEGNRHLIEDGENGLLFRSGDAAALAEAIRRLYSDAAERARMSSRAREIYEERFTAAVPVRKTEDVYRALAARRRAEKHTEE